MRSRSGGGRTSSRAATRLIRRTADEDALAQHAAPLVERDERQLREPIDLGQRLAERLERGVAGWRKQSARGRERRACAAASIGSGDARRYARATREG